MAQARTAGRREERSGFMAEDETMGVVKSCGGPGGTRSGEKSVRSMATKGAKTPQPTGGNRCAMRCERHAWICPGKRVGAHLFLATEPWCFSFSRGERKPGSGREVEVGPERSDFSVTIATDAAGRAASVGAERSCGATEAAYCTRVSSALFRRMYSSCAGPPAFLAISMDDFAAAAAPALSPSFSRMSALR